MNLQLKDQLFGTEVIAAASSETLPSFHRVPKRGAGSCFSYLGGTSPHWGGWGAGSGTDVDSAGVCGFDETCPRSSLSLPISEETEGDADINLPASLPPYVLSI